MSWASFGLILYPFLVHAAVETVLGRRQGLLSGEISPFHAQNSTSSARIRWSNQYKVHCTYEGNLFVLSKTPFESQILTFPRPQTHWLLPSIPWPWTWLPPEASTGWRKHLLCKLPMGEIARRARSCRLLRRTMRCSFSWTSCVTTIPLCTIIGNKLNQ